MQTDNPIRIPLISDYWTVRQLNGWGVRLSACVTGGLTSANWLYSSSCKCTGSLEFVKTPEGNGAILPEKNKISMMTKLLIKFHWELNWLFVFITSLC